MDQETCLIHGQASPNLLLLEEKPPNGHMWSGKINETTADIQARSFMARTLGRKWERMPS